VTVVGDQYRFRTVFKKWFVAMVAGWMNDEVVNQHVLVFIGKQGIYKTTWLERLLPPELRSYGCKLCNLHDMDKDDRLRIAEYGLINIDEIDALTERELNQMKSVITSSDVNERAAYGYNKERRIRLASFCASGNKREFLTDTTGNRRWLPFEVESIVSPFMNPYQPYEMIYAQAWWLIEHGFNYWFDTDDIRALEQHTESFHRETSEEQLLRVFYTPATLETQGAVLRTAAEISAKLTWQGNIKHPMSLQQLGRLLSLNGFEQKRITGGVRCYIVIENQRNAISDEANINRLRSQSSDNSDNTF
jgi:predicted P-loop ATPase